MKDSSFVRKSGACPFLEKLVAPRVNRWGVAIVEIRENHSWFLVELECVSHSFNNKPSFNYGKHGLAVLTAFEDSSSPVQAFARVLGSASMAEVTEPSWKFPGTERKGIRRLPQARPAEIYDARWENKWSRELLALNERSHGCKFFFATWCPTE